MKNALFILFLSLSWWSNGQTNNAVLDLTKDSDTLFWQKYKLEEIKDFNLPLLDTTSDFVFRRWNSGSLLEIKRDRDSISGKIFYFVFEVWEEDYKADTFVQIYTLPSSISTKLYDYISTSKIRNIPSDKFIKGWQQGFDGISHIYELKENNSYSFKKYWTPGVQEGIKEAELIIEFNNRIGEIGNLERYGKDFVEKVPFITYRYPGAAYAITKVPTKKELRKYKRDRKKEEKKNKR